MIFGVALLLALVIGACSSGDGDGGEAAQAEPDPPPPAGDVDGDGDGEPDAAPDGGPADADEGSADVDAPVDVDEPPAEVDEPVDDAEGEDENADADEPPEADSEGEPAETRDRADLLLQASEFAQTSPAVDVEDIPPRPDDFADFGRVALPWLQTRTSVAAIVPLFVAWAMPPVSGGFRLNLVDTNGDALFPGDGRSAVAIIYTDPPGDRATGYSNLVVYEPLIEAPGRFRIVYDHDQVEQSFGAEFGRTGIVVTSVADVNGDGLRDISFEELICDGTGCTRLLYVLSNTGDGYRRVLN